MRLTSPQAQVNAMRQVNVNVLGHILLNINPSSPGSLFLLHFLSFSLYFFLLYLYNKSEDKNIVVVMTVSVLSRPA